MRVNAIARPSGDQTGHASTVASAGGDAADAGSATVSNSKTTSSVLTREP